MENNEETVIQPVTDAQSVFALKLLGSKRILDKEYRNFMKIWQNQIVSSKDASIFIEHVLALVKFRRNFCSKKHKAYKKCVFCNSRDNIVKYVNLETGKEFWTCESCAINLRDSRKVPVQINENGK